MPSDTELVEGVTSFSGSQQSPWTPKQKPAPGWGTSGIVSRSGSWGSAFVGANADGELIMSDVSGNLLTRDIAGVIADNSSSIRPIVSAGAMTIGVGIIQATHQVQANRPAIQFSGTAVPADLAASEYPVPSDHSASNLLTMKILYSVTLGGVDNNQRRLIVRLEGEADAATMAAPTLNYDTTVTLATSSQMKLVSIDITQDLSANIAILVHLARDSNHAADNGSVNPATPGTMYIHGYSFTVR